MRAATIAKSLLVLGLLVGAATGLALALGFDVDRIPSWMITVGMYKLAFIAAAGLLVAGALMGRAIRERGIPEASRETEAQLRDGSDVDAASVRARRDREEVKRDRR
jgi:hypothetical protein